MATAYLGNFHILATANNAVINAAIKVHVSFSISVGYFFVFVFQINTQEWNYWIPGALQVALVAKNLPANAGNKRHRLDLGIGKILWRRKWQPTSVFLPGKSHRERRLVGYSLWGHKSQTRLRN